VRRDKCRIDNTRQVPRPSEELFIHTYLRHCETDQAIGKFGVSIQGLFVTCNTT